MIGGNLIGNVLSTLISSGQATSPVEETLTNLNWLEAVAIVILAPLSEEFICRKLIIDHTVRYGEKTALVFSALTFGLLHRNFYQFFYAFGLGLIFGYIYLRSGRLRYSIGFHMIINFMGGVIAPALLKLMNYDAIVEAMEGNDPQAVMDVMSGNPTWMGIAYGYMMLLGIGVMAGIAFLIIRFREIRFWRLPEELPRGTVICTAFLNIGMVLFTGACAILMVLDLFV